MLIYGLIGRTLSHSWSAQIHKALGCDDYRLIELEPEALKGFLERTDIGGLNVTIPYKRDVMPLCAELADSARRVGSVNTIVPSHPGLCGHNTDLYGLQYALRRAGISLSGRKVLILGSGGASLAAKAAAEIDGAREIVVISRSGPDNYQNISRHHDAEVIINATPVGMSPNNGVLILDPVDFPRCTGVADMIYNPLRTAFLMRAETLGLPRTDGLPMLVAQAAAAEELFTGQKGARDKIEDILRDLRQGMENIILIGMPGCGKTTVGKELAEMTGRPLIDIDQEIVRAAGRSIEDIFADDGESTFRRLEREQTAIAGRKSGHIIVTGGGVVKSRENYSALHQNGRIYNIERDITLLERKGRPLSLAGNLEAMYRERRPLYEQFQDIALLNNKTPHEAAETIWRDFLESVGH
ncbi:MAG: AAA family ATPase [Fretibacterium sp.]|nr:AAA family ATPase [Fretibacterium sp.]